jgi:hypothetical protein
VGVDAYYKILKAASESANAAAAVNVAEDLSEVRSSIALTHAIKHSRFGEGQPRDGHGSGRGYEKPCDGCGQPCHVRASGGPVEGIVEQRTLAHRTHPHLMLTEFELISGDCVTLELQTLYQLQHLPDGNWSGDVVKVSELQAPQQCLMHSLLAPQQCTRCDSDRCKY